MTKTKPTSRPGAKSFRMRRTPKGHLLRFLGRGSPEYALRFIKSVAKIAIGRKPYFYPQDLFLLAYLRQLMGHSRVCITCKLTDYSGEGGGSHAISMMTVIDFARSLDLGYVHRGPETPQLVAALDGGHSIRAAF